MHGVKASEFSQYVESIQQLEYVYVSLSLDEYLIDTGSVVLVYHALAVTTLD